MHSTNLEQENMFPLIYCFINYVHMYMSVCRYMHMSAHALRAQKKVLDTLKSEL